VVLLDHFGCFFHFYQIQTFFINLDYDIKLFTIINFVPTESLNNLLDFCCFRLQLRFFSILARIEFQL
jgi:hypothetical protein